MGASGIPTPALEPYHYTSAMAMPGLPEDKIQETRKATESYFINPQTGQPPGQTFGESFFGNAPQLVTKTIDAPISADDRANWESAHADLVSRYNAEGQQEQSLVASLQNRRRGLGTGGGGGTILTAPFGAAGAPRSTGTTGSGGKTLLGQ